MINVAGILICLSILFYTTDVQAQNHSPEQPQDSVPVLMGDSTLQQLRGDSTVRQLSADSTLQQAADTIQAVAKNGKEVAEKQDTLKANGKIKPFEITSDKFFAPSYMFSPSPRKAVLFSAIFPGLGQIYNRKYWKLPILYGGFVGLTYSIIWNNGYYQDYLGAYIDIVDDNPNSNRWHNMLAYGQDYETVDIPWLTSVLQQRKDHYRYYRDLSIIITVGLYFIAIVDAYVDAQLFDFDISPDLSMRVTPAIIRGDRAQYKGSSSYGVQWSFNF